MQVSTTRILVDCYFDSQAAKLVYGRALLTVSKETGLIHEIGPCPEHLQDVEIDLRGLTVLPGLVDTHVHRQRRLYLL